MKYKNLLFQRSAMILAVLLCYCLQPAFSYTSATVGTATSTSSTSGPSSSTSAGNRNERHACIYSVAELTAAGMSAGNKLFSVAWEKTGVASYVDNDLTIRIWLKHSSVTAFAANPVFATETASATQVFETTSGTIPAAAGWLTFSFNTNYFIWNGTDNIEVITEIIRPASWTTTGFLWRTIGTLTNAAGNANGTVAAPVASLTRTSTRPQVRFEIATPGNDGALVNMPNPLNAAPGPQNIEVGLRNTGTDTLKTASIEWNINSSAPTVYQWVGSLAPGAQANVIIGVPSFNLGTNTVHAKITSANAGLDNNAANDTISKTVIICNTLSGSYTINKTLGTSGTNFNSFKDFAHALSSCGISGHVIATVAPGTGPYREQVIFEDIQGLNVNSTITIEGSGETINTDTAINQLGSNPNRHVIRLVDLKYFTINNLRIDMITGSTGFMGIHLSKSADNITISNCTIDMGTASSTLLGAIAATGSEISLLAGGNYTNLHITRNKTIGGGYGIVCYGLSNTTTADNIISHNTINGSNSNGIYVQNNNRLIISSDTLNFTAGNGMQIAGAGNINTLVEKNVVSCTNPTTTSVMRGIYMFGNTAASPNKVVNNIVRDMNAPLAPISAISNRTAGAEFYYNTVILNDATATGTLSFAYEEDAANSVAKLQNNIFSVTRPGSSYAAAIALSSTSVVTTAAVSNNNVFHTGTGIHVAVRKGTLTSNPPANIYSTLANWNTASSQDALSFQTDPSFQTGTAIPSSGIINDQAAPLVDVTTDIVGVTRPSQPDPGAYEFTPAAADAAITKFFRPASPYCSSTLPVQFELTNAGAAYLFSVTINWSVNGVPQTPVVWSGSALAPGASEPILLGTIPVNSTDAYTFIATASNPNGVTDANPANDQLTYNGFRTGISGTFTIDKSSPVSSSNYTSFQSVANDLSLYGVCGPATFTVINGPYTEQVKFDSIPGTNVLNTVTLNGNQQELNFNTTVSSNDYILQLNKVSYMTVENLTIRGLHATQGRGIQVSNGSSKIVLRNNTINVSTTNSTSSSFGIIVSGTNWLLDGSLSDSLLIEGNTITGGYSGIQLSGEHWTRALTNVQVINNTIQDWYAAGVYLSYTSGALISKNKISRPTRTNSGSDSQTPGGITITAGSANFMLDKNRIFNLENNMPASTTVSRGIFLSGTTTAPSSGTIQNNLIYGLGGMGSHYGIQNNSVTGPVKIYHNTISLDGADGASSSATNAIYLSNSGTQSGATDISNNILSVTRGGTGTKRIFEISGASTVIVANHNVGWLSATSGTSVYARKGTTNYATLADWQTATSVDANSVAFAPAFVAPATGDFQPSNPLIEGSMMGVNSLGVLDDILDSVRNPLPDPGAYEFGLPPCTGAVGGTAIASLTNLCGSGSASITATGYSTGSGSLYQWQYSADNFVSDIHDLSGEINPAAMGTGTISATTYYRLKVTCPSGTATAYSNTLTIIVTPAASATIAYSGSPFCGNTGTITVNRTGTTGGTFSSTAGLSINSSTGAIDLAASTRGTYTITYTVAANGACPQFQTTAVVTLSDAPSATISYTGSPYCKSAGTATVTQTGTTGGTYSSTAGLSINSTTGAVNLAASTAGTYTVTYNIAAAGSCPSAQTTTTITITEKSATISYAGSPYCNSATTAAVTLTGTTGGTFSSTAGLSINSSTGAIDPSASTAGTYTVTYSIAAGDGCPLFTTTATVSITATPSATIAYAGSPYCTNGTAQVTLTGTTGGTFSSTAGLSINSGSGEINLASSTADTYTVTYTIAAAGGCAAVTSTTSVTINLPPVVNLGADKEICQGDSVELDAGNPGASYLWSTGATTRTIMAKTAGVYSVTVTNTNLCSASDEISVSLKASPSAAFTSTVNPSNYLEYQFTGPAQTGSLSYSWDFGNGSTSLIQNPVHLFAAPGTYTVTLSVTNLNTTCTAVQTSTLEIQPVGIGARATNDFRLSAAPNPFATQTNISFELAAPSEVTLEVYDLLGKKVDVLLANQLLSGKQRIEWLTENLHSGNYLVRLSVNGQNAVIKIVHTN